MMTTPSVRARSVALLLLLAAVQRSAASAPITLPIRVSLVEQRNFDNTINYRLSANAAKITLKRTEALYRPMARQSPIWDCWSSRLGRN